MSWATLFDEAADTQALIREYFSAAYGSRSEEVLSYLGELSRLSSCDYLNGKGPRVDPEIAARMDQIVNLCQNISIPQPEDGSALFWKLLSYHRAYVEALSRATASLAKGDIPHSRIDRLALRDLICRNELEYQPYLDVYRILEITEKYTGFPPIEE